MSVSWRNPRRRRSLDKKSGSPDHQSEMEANDDKTERSPPQVTTHSQATEQADLMSLCVWEYNPIVRELSWFEAADVVLKFEIYILKFIPSRRPHTNSKPIVFKMYPFLSEIAFGCSWWRDAMFFMLFVERRNVVCGEAQFSRGCWWRGAIFLMLVVGREPPQFRPQAREAPVVLVPLVPPHNVDVEVSRPLKCVATNLAW